MKNNEINMFMVDSKADIGSLFSIKLHTMKFTDYKIITLPELAHTTKLNIDVVAGVQPVITCGSPEKLFDIEFDHIHTTDFNSDNFFEIMSILKDITKGFDTGENISTVKILDLCKKYGIKINSDLQKQYNRVFGFDLRKFKYRLYNLYWCFTVYMAIHEGNYASMAKIVPEIKEIKTRRIVSEHDILEYAKEWLSLSCGNISITLKPSPSGFVLVSEVNDIISACYVFISLMAAGITVQGDKKINLKHCPNCGDFFSGHGNKKYCPRCDRRTVFSRIKAEEARQKKLKQ